ncbi:ribbon-helix-helix protein, CopG family [Candidatus Woesearchaeota archaeon]|nr:ribbon-helix-helix protein, CopG family [Candidatus Woesearchaeota archaeon]
MSNQIRITVSDEIDKLLEQLAKKLGKKKSMLARELMEQRLYDIEVIQKGIRELWEKRK